MALVHVPKLLFFDTKYFKLRTIGICLSSCGSQKYFSILHFLNTQSNFNSKDWEFNSESRKSSENKTVKSEEFTSYNVARPKFQAVKLHRFESNSNVSEKHIFETFLKMCFIYFRYRENPKFLKELETLKKSSAFKNFCKAVNNRLTAFSPNTLSIFCNLEYFGVPVTSPLLRKVFTLLLDNINSFSPLDMLDLYLNISKKSLEGVKECQNIKKACELYFSNVLEDALDNVKSNEFLLEYLDKDLPDSAKKSIIQNCLRKEKLKQMYQSDVNKLLIKLCCDYYKFLSKDELLNFVRYCCRLFSASKLNMKVVYAYSVLVVSNNTYYDEKICEQLVYNINHDIESVKEKFHAIKNLVSLGYVDYDLINHAVNFLITAHVYTLAPSQIFDISILLARISYQEEGSEAETVKNSLELYNMRKTDIKFSKLCNWCESLTFLGCDTRNLLTSIFNSTNKYFSTVIQEKNVLSLHHMAKAYFSDGYEPLDSETLQNCLKAKVEVQNQKSVPEKFLNDYFESEDYVLESCTTSDYHFLDFVAVFGPDKKPINLSSYKVSGKLFNIENIKKPPGSQMIVFQKYPGRQPIRFFNVPAMTGTAKMFLKTLENVGCSIVLLPKQLLISSPEYRKNYLTTQINEILEKKSSE